jgi:tetratricopeptide (TPR) repeat protein
MTITRRFQFPLAWLPFVQLLLVALFAVVMAAPAEAAREKRDTKKREAMFPNVARKDVTPKGSARFDRQFQRMVDLANKDKFAESLAVAEEVINHPKATPADRAIALQNASYAVSQLDDDDYSKSIEYVERAIAENALGNDAHYQLMRQAAQMRLAEEQYPEGLAHLERFMAETGSREPELLVLKANALYRQERFEEAITALREAIDSSEKPQDNWLQLLMACYFELERPLDAAKIAEELVARSPDDRAALMRLASIYAQADMYEKATEVLEGARRRGMLTEDRDYRHLYSMYFNMDGKEQAAIDVIEEGLQNGILNETTEAHVALAQAYYFTDRTEKAIEHYRRAAPLAKDGEASLNLARLLSNEDRSAETKVAAQEALAKGVKRPGDAWMIIARAEFGLDNRAAMIAAYREAAKFPETKDQAGEWLRKNAR